MTNPPSTPGGHYEPDQVSRIIMLIYGKMNHGGPFWCYVAVKPSQFEAFKLAEKEGRIDLYNFETYGEVIVSAEGQTPPEDVTRKVAEMYNADPSTFFQPMDPIEEIGKKIEEMKLKDQTPKS